MPNYIKLQIGDTSENGQITIIDEDRLCYIVKSSSNGAVGNRTISKALLKEFVDYLEKNPQASSSDARTILCGTSDIDKFEYGYNATLTAMAKMVLGQVGVVRAKNTYSVASPLDQPLQQIFYGAPGTGKSHTINRETKGRKTFRTTFHPDSDYSTFVGAYKPVMEEVETRVVPVVLSNGASFNQNQGTLKEKKISYRFVKQAFMKAYIAAWREFAQLGLAAPSTMMTPPSQPNQVRLSSDRNQGEVWIVKKVEDDKVEYSKDYVISDKDKFADEVKGFWQKLSTSDNVTLKTNEHLRAAVCDWYDRNHESSGTADDCWNAAWEELQGGKSIMGSTPGQTYSYSLDDNGNIVVSSSRNASKGTIAKYFNSNDPATSAEKSVAKKLREYGVEDFDTAWERLKAEVNKGELTLAPTQTEPVSTIAPVFLIIEEINRGNCAQIFGDLFQLLDRKEGFSQYPIHADEDVRKCLVSEHSDEDPSFGIGGLEFSPEQKDNINSLLDCEDDVAEKIARGEVLVLPPNLYIWATMNTSDQSLFPIDSAFKRRWEWRYIPITKGKDKESGKMIQWSIEAEGVSYDWWSFLEVMNKRVGDITSSEDKKLGFFFCKADKQGIISADKFVSKVMFYLWNDVFKDYPDNPIAMYLKEEGGEFTYGDFYTTNTKGEVVVREELVTRLLDALEVKVNEDESEDENENISADKTGNYTKRHLKVVYPDGTVIEHNNSTTTLLAVINYAGPARVAALDLKISGLPMVADYQLEPEGKGYATSQRLVNDGYWVMTKLSTNAKLGKLTEISNRLGLGLQVSIVEL